MNINPTHYLSFSWNLLKKEWQAVLIMGVVWLFAVYAPIMLFGEIYKNSPGIASLFNLVFIGWSIFVSIGMIRYGLKLVDGKKPQVADIFNGIIPLGLGLLITTPMTYLAQLKLYRDFEKK